MNDIQLKYLLSIAETGSFTRTAERYFVSQPTVSSQIKQLERELGFLLFKRLKNKCVLTEAGEEYVDFVKELLPKHNRICAKARNTQEKSKNTLSVGILDNCYSASVYSALHHTQSEYDDFELDVVVAHIDNLEYDLKDRVFDIIIAPQDLIDTTPYKTKLIEAIDLVLIYNLKDRDPMIKYSLNSFEGENLLLADMSSTKHSHILDVANAVFANKGLSIPRMQNVPNDRSLIAAVRAGLGVGLDSLDQPELLRGDLGYVKTGLKYSIIAAWSDKPDNKPLQTFLNALDYFSSGSRTTNESSST